MEVELLNCIWSITTYNRITFLKRTIKSWLATRNPLLNWTILIADDGSVDDTLNYILSLDLPIKLLLHQRKGVHYQTNKLLQIAEKTKFDIGFKTDDDLIFKKKGWDDKYIQAIQETAYDHLVFHDPTWKRKKHKITTKVHSSGLLECCAHRDDTQGAFWTFTPEILKKVGYFDLSIYGKRGWGHRDYTMRCCKAGFNSSHNVYDITNSNDHIQLNQENYWSHSPPSPSKGKDKATEQKISHLYDRRIYIPYNTKPFLKMHL